MNRDNIATIIVNYNNYDDTINCFKSLWALKEVKPYIIIVDNASTNSSVIKIVNFLNAYIHKEKFEVIDYDESFVKANNLLYDVTIIKSKANKGFAGGNNLGIKLIYDFLNIKNFDFWLINSDAVADENALFAIKNYVSKNNIGIAGSIVFDYYNRSTIQSIGGKINQFFATNINCTELSQKDELHYIYGASFYISNKVINKIGLLPEEYFMYYEETDYCFLARKLSFKIGIATNAFVYHKGSIGKLNKNKDLMQLENRLLFARKQHFNIFFVKLGLIISIILRIYRLQFNRIYAIAKLILFK